MEFDPGALRRAHGALRTHGSTNNADEDSAYGALSDLIEAARMQGDAEVVTDLLEARDMLKFGSAGAKAAETALERLEAR